MLFFFVKGNKWGIMDFIYKICYTPGMTIETQLKIGGIIPIGKKQEAVPGESFRHRFDRIHWSVETEVYIRNPDILVVAVTEKGLVVDPDEGYSRSADQEKISLRAYTKSEINESELAVPISVAPGVVRVFSWKSTEQ